MLDQYRMTIIDGPFGIDAIEILDGPFNDGNGYLKYHIKVRRKGEWELKMLPVSWINAVWSRQNKIDILELR